MSTATTLRATTNHRKPSPAKRRFDLDGLKAAASGRWVEILSALGQIPAAALDGGHHPCPLCGGHDRFRCIDQTAGSVLCNQCFRDGNGDGIAALQWARGWDFVTAVRELADYLQLPAAVTSGNAGGSAAGPAVNGQPDVLQQNTRRADTSPGMGHQEGSSSAPTSESKADPAASLTFSKWLPVEALRFTRAKPGISADALLPAGAHFATYRKIYPVVAIPSFGPSLLGATPCGWTVYGRNGKLPSQAGPVGKKQTEGSKSGLIGRHGIARLAKRAEGRIEIVWKVEGPTDLLALFSAIPAELRDRHVVITNAAGAGEKPAPWILDLLSGLKVCVIHDCDIPGQQGATVRPPAKPGQSPRPGWCPLLAEKCSEVRNVVLPYPIVQDHGKDLRDWLAEGHTYQQLVELADAAPVCPKPPPQSKSTPSGANSDKPKCGELDTLPTARVFAETLRNQEGALRLRLFRGDFFEHDGRRYHETAAADVEARLIGHLDKVATHITRPAVANILQCLRSLLLIESRLDFNVWLDNRRDRGNRNFIAMENGILDVDGLLAGKTEVLCQHSPAWFSLNCLNYKFVPDATCPIWEAFLETNLEEDKQRIAIIQEWAGLNLVSDTSFQKFMIMVGEGSNGKSVLCAGLAGILGTENCSHVPFEQFGERFQLTRTLGKLANITAEVGDIDKGAEGILKSFTSGDRMTFERKYRDPVEAVPTARLTLATNTLPRFADRSDGIWRRLLLLPFRVQIADHQKVRGMDRIEFWQECDQLPGMFLWALRGLQRLRQQGRFTESDVCTAAHAEYRTESNPARQFLTEHYCVDVSGDIVTADAYRQYKNWCEENGHRPLSSRTFGREIVRTFPTALKAKVWSFEQKRAEGYRGITAVSHQQGA